MPEPTATERRAKIIDDIAWERTRQDERWGGPAHDDEHAPFDWLTYIDTYVTKVVVDDGVIAEGGLVDPEQYRRRLVQIAALAVAALESLDRTRGPEPHGARRG